MESICEALENFMVKYSVVTNNVVNSDSEVFYPFIRFDAVLYLNSGSRYIVNWESGIFYNRCISSFGIRCKPVLVGLHCINYNFRKLNRLFDGTLESIISYLDSFNDIRDVDFKYNAIVITDAGNIRLSDCVVLERNNVVRLV